MSELRGRPYAFVILTMMCWIGARLAWPETQDEDSKVAFPAKGRAAGLAKWPPETKVQSAELQSVMTRPLPIAAAAPTKKRMPPKARAKIHSHHLGLPPASDPWLALVPWQVGGRPSGLPMLLRVAGDGKSLSAGRDTPPTNAHAPVGKAGLPELLRLKRWDIYAYSFWRASGGQRSALGPIAQYGGSQSGVIATLDPFGVSGKGVVLLTRAAVTPDGDEREVAVGLRWKPDNGGPMHLSGEYRVRADTRDLFAVYMSGGVNAVPLVASWSLDAYGQAGYASGQGGGAFFDAQARVMRPLSNVGGIPLSIGAGSWGGGQRGAKRLDVGPTLAAKVDTGPAVVLIQLDWRLRVAGNAEPQNGLALTVSTGF